MTLRLHAETGNRCDHRLAFGACGQNAVKTHSDNRFVVGAENHRAVVLCVGGRQRQALAYAQLHLGLAQRQLLGSALDKAVDQLGGIELNQGSVADIDRAVAVHISRLFVKFTLVEQLCNI